MVGGDSVLVVQGIGGGLGAVLRVVSVRRERDAEDLGQQEVSRW